MGKDRQRLGISVPVRLLGVIEAEQSERGKPPTRNDRLVAVAVHSTERGSLPAAGAPWAAGRAQAP